MGAYVAITSELVWGIVSPYGFGGYIIPFLISGEILYAVAGFTASRIWGKNVDAFSEKNLYFGAMIAICAFIWDTETNFATALIATWPSTTLLKLLTYEVFGSPFMILHEVGDFVIGASLAPIAITFFLRTVKKRPDVSRARSESETKRIKV